MRLLLVEYRQAKKELNNMIKFLRSEEKRMTKEIEMNDENKVIDFDIMEELDLVKDDVRLVTSMIDSVSKTIQWIETGINPYFHKGVDKKYKYDITSLENMDLLPDIAEQLTEEREELVMTEEQKEALIKIFELLTKRERDCVILHIAHGKSMAETGELLGIGKTTVNTHIMRARKKIDEVVR